MRSAGAVAVRDGRQTLHVSSEKIGEGLTLGVAQLRKLGGHMRDGAVVLTDLHAVAYLTGRRGKSSSCERVGDSARCFFHVYRATPHRRLDVGHDGFDSLACEGLDRAVPADLAQLTHCCACKIVVGVSESAATDCRQLKILGRSSTASLGDHGRGRYSRLTVVDECFEMPSYPSSAEAQTGTDIGGGDRALFEK